MTNLLTFIESHAEYYEFQYNVFHQLLTLPTQVNFISKWFKLQKKDGNIPVS